MAIETGLHGTIWPWGVVPTAAVDADAVEGYLRRICGTSLGERKMDPRYGGQVHAVIFANQGAAFEALAKRELRLAISRGLPSVKVLKIDIEYPSRDNEGAAITVDYEYLGSVGRMQEALS